MLYYGKIHHAHEAMAESIGADLIQVDAGGPLSRIRAARTLDLGDRPVIIEGGIPLFQAAWMDVFDHCGPLIHLAADEALMNIFNGLDHYSLKDRLAHGWAHRHVNAVLAVSPRLASEARALGIDHVKVIHPFPDEWKWNALVDNEPKLDSNRILAVGSNRPKNNLRMLNSVGKACESDVVFDVVGPDTEKIQDTEHVVGHGFVEQDRFIRLFAESQAFVLPAVSQPFPVSTLEALVAGLPPFVTDETGTSPFIRKVHPKLVQNNTPAAFARAIDWYASLPTTEKETISERTRQMGAFFDRETGKETFAEAYEQAMEGING
jgi:glycosyltransferase involved in cell wall biosynthesis